ncbi:unnamed protein product [Knipowitschia caucasica]|uniref:RING-type domain-containing protein n=1 Tax=Knipowitschia caucasica TaxID=637954 RepID=A0AAV2MFN2_KNICA
MSDSRDRAREERPPPQQNVKPKFSGRQEPRSTDKPKPRRSRSIDSVRDRGRRRERHAPGEHRRGRSEEARGRKHGEKPKKYVPEDSVDDTECAICFCSYDNNFKTPKLLSCGHTFCLECLARINVLSAELKSLPCPVCREVTQIPHGQDLPRLGTNQDVVRRLPPQMQRVLSIRFKRSKGKLMLKTQTPMGSVKAASPVKEKPQVDVEAARTVVDVGRPPSRVHGRLRRRFRSDRCYCAVLASVLTVTVVLMLIGILAFIIVPSVSRHRRPGGHQGNFTGAGDSP